MHLMRHIESNLKTEWDNLKKTEKPIGPYEDCEPKLINGWTDQNLSLWDVTDGPNKPTLQKILVALCRRKKNWDKIAYLIFDKAAVDKSGLQITPTNGNTGDQKIDISKTHYEIKALTGKSLCTLLYHIVNSEYKTGYFKKSELDDILFSVYDQNFLIPTSINITKEHLQTNYSISGTSNIIPPPIPLAMNEKALGITPKPLITDSSTAQE